MPKAENGALLPKADVGAAINSLVKSPSNKVNPSCPQAGQGNVAFFSFRILIISSEVIAIFPYPLSCHGQGIMSITSNEMSGNQNDPLPHASPLNFPKFSGYYY
jgi:hypothetical protein